MQKKFILPSGEKIAFMTRDEVVGTLDEMVLHCGRISLKELQAVIRARDALKMLSEDVEVCKCEERHGRPTMFHKQFVDQLKAELKAEKAARSSAEGKLAIAKRKIEQVKKVNRSVAAELLRFI